jgi:hypothetical protein
MKELQKQSPQSLYSEKAEVRGSDNIAELIGQY